MVSRAVLERAAPILCVSHDEDDHGWQFLHTAEPVDDVEELVLVHLGHVLEFDPSVQELADLEPGWIATRASHGAAWVLLGPAWHEGFTDSFAARDKLLVWIWPAQS